MITLPALPLLAAVAIPDPDPIPLPAPIGLLAFLLLLTFVLHVLAMNWLLGGSLLLVVSRMRVSRAAAEIAQFHRRLIGTISRILPATVAFTITLGIAPLLFVQVLYGPLFFSSAILMAWPWLALVGMLMLAYYAAYWLAFKAKEAKEVTASAWAAVLVAGLFLAVAFLFVNNVSMMQAPETWRSLYDANPSGLVLYAAHDPAVLLRYLHFVFGPLAVAGLIVAGIGVAARRQTAAFGEWAKAYGGRFFLLGTLLQAASGILFLAAQPQPVRDAILRGGSAESWLLGVAVASAVLALAVLAPPRRVSAARLVAGGAALALTVVLMVLLRQRVRTLWLAPHFRYETLAVQPQWPAIALFAALLLVGIAVLSWMVWRFVKCGMRNAGCGM